MLPRLRRGAGAVADPQRHFTTIKYRIAKGSFDHLVGERLGSVRLMMRSITVDEPTAL
jgi:hypothetical protein